MKSRPLYLGLFLLMLMSCGGNKKSSQTPVVDEPVALASSPSSSEESLPASIEEAPSSSQETPSDSTSQNGDIIEGPIILI